MPRAESEVLYSSDAIRTAIGQVLSPRNGRRVVAVAFVGSGADAYLPQPAGIELYCWPDPQGTNADAIGILQKKEVAAHFVSKLHAKLYWSERGGAVITSANLSTNALGKGGLFEFGIAVGRGVVNIDRFLRQFGAHPVTAASLAELARQNAAVARVAGVRRALPTFGEWFDQQTGARWLVAKIIGHCPPSAPARRLAKEERGSKEPEDWLSCRKGEVEPDNFVLCIDIANGAPPSAKWIYAHTVLKVPVRDRTYRRGSEWQVVQMYPHRQCPQLPFRLDKPFGRALRSIDWTRIGIERPGKRLLGQLHREYIAQQARN